MVNIFKGYWEILKKTWLFGAKYGTTTGLKIKEFTYRLETPIEKITIVLLLIFDISVIGFVIVINWFFLRNVGLTFITIMFLLIGFHSIICQWEFYKERFKILTQVKK